MKKGFFAIFPLILTACSSIPSSYLPEAAEPIVNIEAPAAAVVKVKASKNALCLTNQTDTAQALSYKLFWYNQQGVSQSENGTWQPIILSANERREIALQKPTADSETYRLYLRAVK